MQNGDKSLPMISSTGRVQMIITLEYLFFDQICISIRFNIV